MKTKQGNSESDTATAQTCSHCDQVIRDDLIGLLIKSTRSKDRSADNDEKKINAMNAYLLIIVTPSLIVLSIHRRQRQT